MAVNPLCFPPPREIRMADQTFADLGEGAGESSDREMERAFVEDQVQFGRNTETAKTGQARRRRAVQWNLQYRQGYLSCRLRFRSEVGMPAKTPASESDKPNQPDTSRAVGKTVVAQFDICCRRYLSPTGALIANAPDFVTDPALMKRLYRQMTLTRAFDEKAVALQRTGRLGTYASVLGQEAVGAGVACAMTEADILLPSFREHGAQLERGVSVEELLTFWGGSERGSDFQGPRRDFPVCIPVASQFPLAAGAAWALHLRGEPGAAVVFGGDGATSKGDFYEALNIAGVWDLPLLAVIVNNGWAISVPRAEQSRAATLAQKAIAVGVPGEIVDGNDVLAMYAAARQALGAIHAGGGPRLIEAATYRLGDHTTADDARRYREDEDVSPHWKVEPLARMRRYLGEQGLWTKPDEEALIKETKSAVDTGVEAYLNEDPEPPTAMFDHLFAVLPDALKTQRNELATEGGPADA